MFLFWKKPELQKIFLQQDPKGREEWEFLFGKEDIKGLMGRSAGGENVVEVSEDSQDWYHLEMPEAGRTKTGKNGVPLPQAPVGAQQYFPNGCIYHQQKPQFTYL